jgi:hypothetical protein
MRTFDKILTLLLILCSCRNESKTVEAEVTKVAPHYDLRHWNFPHVTFSISIRNQGNRPTPIYVNRHGRTPPQNSGLFWVYYNNGTDSLKLYSASCKHCTELTTLHPNYSLNLILQIDYADVSQKVSSQDSVDLIHSEIREVSETWNAVKYFDNTNKLVFESLNHIDKL